MDMLWINHYYYETLTDLPLPTNDNATPPTAMTTPYINGIFEIISRIHVAYKPIITLRQLLTNVTDKDEPRNRQGAVHKISRSDCHAFYIGETSLLTEHKRATRKI